MRQKLGRKVYDTEKAEYIGDQTVGYFGEDYGFQETLYRRAADDFFIVGRGGSRSPYPQETLAALDMEATEEWLRRVLGDERAEEVLAKNQAEREAGKSVKKSATTAPKKAASKKPVVKKAPAKKTAEKKTTAKKASQTKSSKK